MATSKIIEYMVYLAIAIIVIMGITMMVITNERCEEECYNRGAIYHDRVQDGKHFSLRDFCTCFYRDRSETFRLG